VVTDFEAYGLRVGSLEPEDRRWLLTVDFEAFEARTAGLWAWAVERWAERASQGHWRFAFFVALEDVAQLRATSPNAHSRMLEALAALHDAGGELHAHNHGPFDPETGVPATSPAARRHRVAGYRKRASFFYDVVHRHCLDPGAWLTTVRAEQVRLAREAGVPPPRRAVFRAGGWDHGATPDECRSYLRALARAGFEIDSSASSGVFGTRSWRVGAPFGENVLLLESGVAEVAANSSLDCGSGPRSLSSAAATLRLAAQPRLWAPRTNGLVVTVLHFDHLFHRRRGRRIEPFAVTEAAEIDARIVRFFRQLRRLAPLVRAPSAGFDEIALAP